VLVGGTDVARAKPHPTWCCAPARAPRRSAAGLGGGRHRVRRRRGARAAGRGFAGLGFRGRDPRDARRAARPAGGPASRAARLPRCPTFLSGREGACRT
jgi:hypothetical protein